MSIPILGNGSMVRHISLQLPRDHMAFLKAAAHEMGRSPAEVAETILVGALSDWASQAILIEMLVRALIPVPTP